MNLDEAEKRYLNDCVYHELVDFIVHQLETLQTTPSEIREIAMYAQYRSEIYKLKHRYPEMKEY